MLSTARQSANHAWPISTGPIVVLARHKNSLNISLNATVSNAAMNTSKNSPIRKCAGNRDGPLIFHMRDGPPNVTGPPFGTGPPEIFSSGFSPPGIKGQTMEWLAKKKTLKKF